jgi:hypothetical protein
MKLRRLIPLALTAYAGWKRLSPERKAMIKSKISSLRGQRAHPGFTQVSASSQPSQPVDASNPDS